MGESGTTGVSGKSCYLVTVSFKLRVVTTQRVSNVGIQITNTCTLHAVCGPGSVAVIATCYGLDGPGSNPSGGRDFSHLSRPDPGPTQPPVQWVPGLSRG